ncbi:HAD-IA family hydrolase [Methyloceanibacter caenitepidi]|uniref:Phosphoglycolate phosphatase n=1 Tax=Methyloceanibacter caenitepidi TaxID=1384459 RepID=A0A0A8K589_9HYPH|nr:HAD-IA family hydrolase [Methyloceanibacter caenitepidi]BAQ17916.1 phosphoglycolate phosphatase [Methyloceanibacter caenitepidi]
MFEGATIVFDLDGTLVDTAPDLTNALNHALQLHGHRTVEPALVREAVGRGAAAMIYEALGIESGTEAIFKDFLIYYEANIATESRPFPGAVALLERLAARGARLAVCTNKRARLANLLLEALELDRHFGAIAGRDTFETCKPHPGHLLGAVAASAGDPARAVMVGDSAVDIEAAQRAGIPSILVTFGYSPPSPEGPRPSAVIDSFETLEYQAEILLKRLTDHDPTRS